MNCKLILLLMLVSLTHLHAQSNTPITITVPAGTPINIKEEVSTNSVRTASPMPPTVVHVTNQSPALPLSVQMRQAAQLAKGKDAPFTQRFIATRVTADARTRDMNGVIQYSTNYFVTFQPISDETNQPIAYGATKAKAFRLEVEYPVKKGDEFLFFPIPIE